MEEMKLKIVNEKFQETKRKKIKRMRKKIRLRDCYKQKTTVSLISPLLQTSNWYNGIIVFRGLAHL